MPPQISAWIPKHNDSSDTSAAKRITTVDYGLEHKGVPRQSSCQSGMPALNRSINLRCESVILSNGKLAASTSALPTLANISSSQPANARHETWKSVSEQAIKWTTCNSERIVSNKSKRIVNAYWYLVWTVCLSLGTFLFCKMSSLSWLISFRRLVHWFICMLFDLWKIFTYLCSMLNARWRL